MSNISNSQFQGMYTIILTKKNFNGTDMFIKSKERFVKSNSFKKHMFGILLLEQQTETIVANSIVASAD